MPRKKPDPTKSLRRFMFGIYDYFRDKGMHERTSKVRMIDATFEEAVKIMKDETDVSDETLVIMMQWSARALNNRGAQITSLIKKQYPDESKVPDELLVPLRDIRDTKTEIDSFITKYKGLTDHATEDKEES